MNAALISRLEKLLGTPRDGALLRFSLGGEYLKGGETAKAVGHLREAVARDPGYSAAWKLLGRALTEAGRGAEALTAYRSGIAAAHAKGDKQAEKEMTVFSRRLEKAGGAPPEPGTALPPITPDTALFLDFDGTLVELAAQPESILVPGDLVATLGALSDKLGGALALVSGRSLADLDEFLAPLRLPAAGEHGAERRTAEGRLFSATPADLATVLQAAGALVTAHPGLKLEKKHHALSLHYRHAPGLQDLCLETMRAAVAQSTGLDLMQGKFVIDVKPAGVNKGAAIAAFMAESPFAGRIPLFAGDDVTDEAGFEAVQAMGGHALKIGTGPTRARYRCTGVAELAAWLRAAKAQDLETPAEGRPA